MKIGILSAMDKELQLVLSLMENVEQTPYEGLDMWSGRIGRHEVVAAKCGIGKVNSALNTFRLIEFASPELIINSGVAGGADASMHVADILVADGVAYHDVWCGPGTEPGTADGYPRIMEPSVNVLEAARRTLSGPGVRYGLICSGDRFISTEAEVNAIKNIFPQALACDMESASIAQTCMMLHTPFAVVRVVSDTPGQAENISQYRNFWGDAPLRTFEAVKTIIENLD